MFKASFYISLFVMLFSTLSFQWPVKKSFLTSTFGESRADHFHDGVDLISQDKNIYSVEFGKVLYEWNRFYFPQENYWGGGNYKIIKHKNNIVSVYMHMKDGMFRKKEYNADDVVGQIGNTGHSFGAHLHFSLLDLDKRISLNPMLYLPKYSDKESPKVLSYALKINNEYTYLRNESNIRLTKHYPLLIDVKDSVTKRERLGVYKLIVKANGKEVFSEVYDKLQYSKSGLINNSKIFSRHFDEKGYYRIENIRYKNGINIIDVTAYDFNGNSTHDTFKVNVTLDL